MHAGFILLSGEVKGRLGLRGQLPERLRELVVNISASGAREGLDDERIAAMAHDLIEDVRHRRIDTVIERFHAEVGRGERGLVAQGIKDTCAVLREANVEALFIGSHGDQEVYAGADPIEITPEASELRDLGISPIDRRRADEALPFAALAVGAELVHTGEELALSEGFGALLRHL